MFKLYNYCCAAVFWKLRRRQIAEFPLGLARVDVYNHIKLKYKMCMPVPVMRIMILKTLGTVQDINPIKWKKYAKYNQAPMNIIVYYKRLSLDLKNGI
jgi:hypothetical protein